MIEPSPGWHGSFLQRNKLEPEYLVHAQEWFGALVSGIAAHQKGAGRTVLVGVNGCQGSGKTTLCDYLRCALQWQHGLRVIDLSIDDFYYGLAQRQQLARQVQPLFATRGVPGTHDMALLESILDSLMDPAAEAPVAVPRFDKGLDDRLPRAQWQQLEGGVDIILLEGWCMGTEPQADSLLPAAVNELERLEDADGRWRSYVNQSLSRDFMALYSRVDQWVMLCAPSFECVYGWRLEQEHKLARASGPQAQGVMSDGEVQRFIQHYERLTRHTLQHLPPQVHYLYQMDQQRRITTFRHRRLAEQ